VDMVRITSRVATGGTHVGLVDVRLMLEDLRFSVRGCPGQPTIWLVGSQVMLLVRPGFSRPGPIVETGQRSRTPVKFLDKILAAAAGSPLTRTTQSSHLLRVIHTPKGGTQSTNLHRIRGTIFSDLSHYDI
jgi:hypothetical protein